MEGISQFYGKFFEKSPFNNVEKPVKTEIKKEKQKERGFKRNSSESCRQGLG